MTGRRVRSGLAWLGAGLAAVVLGRIVLQYLWPFACGALLAMAAEPAVAWLQRHRVPRSLGSALALVGGAGIAGLALLAMVAAMAAELLRLDLRLPDALAVARRLGESLGAWWGGLPPEVRAVFGTQAERLYGGAAGAVGRVAAALQAWAVSGLTRSLADLAVACFSAYFLSRDRPRLLGAVAGWLPPSWRPVAQRIQAALLDSAWGFLRAELLLVAFTFLATWAGLALIGAPFALLAAAVAAVLDLLPLVGPSLLFLPWAAVAWASGLHGAAWGLLAVYGITALIRWAATPWVMGPRVGLHPLAALASLYLGVELFGAAGLLLGPLAATGLHAALRDGSAKAGGAGAGGAKAGGAGAGGAGAGGAGTGGAGAGGGGAGGGGAGGGGAGGGGAGGGGAGGGGAGGGRPGAGVPPAGRVAG